jgi:AhpD family alkylhydroperoxidase
MVLSFFYASSPSLLDLLISMNTYKLIEYRFIDDGINHPQLWPINLLNKNMETRMNMQQIEPLGYKSLFPVEKFLSTSRLTTVHKDLIKIRASQINGCAYCLNLHTREAREAGESEKRIYLLNAWRETSLFNEEEKSILALTEEITLISNHVSDATYQTAAKLFDEHYLAQIILCVVAINAWNRIAITTRLQPEG